MNNYPLDRLISVSSNENTTHDTLSTEEVDVTNSRSCKRQRFLMKPDKQSEIKTLLMFNRFGSWISPAGHMDARNQFSPVTSAEAPESPNTLEQMWVNCGLCLSVMCIDGEFWYTVTSLWRRVSNLFTHISTQEPFMS